MITTIENEHGQVKSIALDGISLLEKKTAEVAADATIRTFYAGASAYVSALINRDTSPLAGTSEQIGILFCTFRKSAGTSHFSWVFLFLFCCCWLD
jgi:hypothetical protein